MSKSYSVSALFRPLPSFDITAVNALIPHFLQCFIRKKSNEKLVSEQFVRSAFFFPVTSNEIKFTTSTISTSDWRSILKSTNVKDLRKNKTMRPLKKNPTFIHSQYTQGFNHYL